MSSRRENFVPGIFMGWYFGPQEHIFGKSTFSNLQGQNWPLCATPYFSTNPDKYISFSQINISSGAPEGFEIAPIPLEIKFCIV